MEAGVKPVALYAGYAAALKFASDETSALPRNEIMRDISKLDENSCEYKCICEFADVLDNGGSIADLTKLAKSKLDSRKK